MSGPSPSARPNPAAMMGGLGNFSDENLEANMMQRQMSQKAAAQQQVSTQPGNGKAGTNPLPAGQQHGIPDGMLDGTHGGATGPTKGTFQPDKPREVGTLKEELIDRPLHDVVAGLKSFFDIHTLLGINPQTDTPEQQAHKREMHKRWQELNQEQQQVAQKMHQEKLQEKEAEKQREEAIKKQKEEAAAQQIAVPSGPKKGPVGPAAGKSNKQNAEMLLQQSRKGIGQNTNKH